MRSVMPMRAAKIGYIVMSLLCCGVGGILLLAPEVSAQWLGRLLGGFMLLFGAVKLAGYFSRDLFRLAFQYDLAFGLLLMVLGAVTLCRPGETLNVLVVLFGIPVLADGLFKIQLALDARRFGIRRWGAICALAVLTGLIGGALVFRPSAGVKALTALLGAALLVDGILNGIVALLTVKIVAHQRPDVIETEEFEVK